MNMRPLSIRRRLVFQLACIAALLSIAFFLSLRAVAEQAATDTQDNILAASATSIADAVYSESGAIRLDLPYSALSMLGTISEDRVFYRVIVEGKTLTGYDTLPAPDGREREAAFSTYQFRGDLLRAVAVTRSISAGNQAQRVLVVVAQTRRGLEAISNQITTTATGIGVAFFVVATSL
ncbi:MAG: sensor histidine kinase N-terminal domain-containing protein, partial [Litoreibacter sp.]